MVKRQEENIIALNTFRHYDILFYLTKYDIISAKPQKALQRALHVGSPVANSGYHRKDAAPADAGGETGFLTQNRRFCGMFMI